MQTTTSQPTNPDRQRASRTARRLLTAACAALVLGVPVPAVADPAAGATPSPRVPSPTAAPSPLATPSSLASPSPVAAPSATPAPPAVVPAVAETHARGTLLSATLLDRLSARQVAAYLAEGGFPARPVSGVDVYCLVYRTITPDGGPTTASGVLALPRNGARELRTALFAHGTLATRNWAPSLEAGSDGRVAAVYFAAAGYAGVAPDYLGLGLGPGPHPYMHAASEASASLDMLRAARAFGRGRNLTLDGRILVTGFSQGGHAAMALGRELQRGTDPGLSLAALAPISGPLDVAGSELPAALSGGLDPRSATFYLAYWLTSMNRIYGLYDDPAEVFRAPYAATVERLFDGTRDFTAIVSELPASPDRLLTPEFRERLARMDGQLLDAIRENDVTCSGWRPGAPVRIYAARGDRDVTIGNSENCRRALRANGADVAPVVDVGPVDHATSAYRSLPQVLEWFRGH